MPRPMTIPVFRTGANLRRPERATPDDARRAARSTLTYEQAEYQMRSGYMNVGEWRWYLFFWTWCAARFGGPAAMKQERAYARLGADGYFSRIARARALRARLAA